MATYAPLLSTESSFILLGGIEVGQETLIRFYVMHVIAFPLIAAHPDGRPLLEDPEGRRHLRTGLRG